MVGCHICFEQQAGKERLDGSAGLALPTWHSYWQRYICPVELRVRYCDHVQ